MPVYYDFPDPDQADKDGLLAVGGDLSVDTLIKAYSLGIFPWFNEGSPILWWSPDPRLVLFPDRFKVSASLRHTIKSEIFKIRFDSNFEQVISQCALIKRKAQEGTWITSEIQQAYVELYKRGFAHSVETYYHNELVGGLYGVSLGKAFFGESMFHRMTDASKVALFYLVEKAKEWGFHFIDAQLSTSHLKSMGAEEIPRKDFLDRLGKALEYPTRKGIWSR